MRYRICDYVHIFADGDESDIYRKFKYQFDNLFNADEVPQNDEEFEEMYVHDEVFEKELYSFLQMFSSSMKFCVGYTGIGKTTSIRHCLKLGVSTVTKLGTKSLSSPTQFMVIFPTFLDGAVRPDGDTFDFVGRIASVCRSLEEQHPELRKITRTPDGRKDFYNFVRKHTPRILETKKDFVSDESTIEDEIKESLSYAQDTFPLEYYANKLKYYIMAENPTYDRLVIVLDDIETLPEKQQHDVISEYLHFFGCMNNTDISKENEYRVTMLISVRPHTLRLYRRKDDVETYRGLEAFSIATNTVLKKNALDLAAFFKKRFDYYTSRSPKTIGNKETWEESYKNLMALNNAFEGKYKSMIINLCFFNVRAALATYSKIFANRFWIQGNRAKEMFFSVNSPEYSFNNINVIRAIGCGNSAVFSGSGDTIIPNLFLTSEREDYSILSLLIMRYFAGDFTDKCELEITYGENAKELGLVFQEWTNAVGKRRTKQLQKVLSYLFEQRILRKSIEDVDDVETLDRPDALDNHSKLYISPRGYELMLMLSRDSVLFEMLQECAWREYDGREDTYSRQSSYELLLQKKQDIIFADLLEYVDYLREQEENFFFDPDETVDLSAYRDIFGSSMMVTHLLKGVVNSLTFSGHIYNRTLSGKLSTVQSNIDESTRRLQYGM